MFNGCTSLQSVNLGNLNTKKISDFSYMFGDCTSLQGVNLSSFDTRNGSKFGGMFKNCRALTSVSLRSFSTAKATSFDSMFENCNALKSVYVNKFDVGSATVNNMFRNCYSITGGNGTKYSGSKSAYVRIDGGSAKPGYLNKVGWIINIRFDGYK